MQHMVAILELIDSLENLVFILRNFGLIFTSLAASITAFSLIIKFFFNSKS